MKIYSILLFLMIGCGLPLCAMDMDKSHATEKHKLKKDKKDKDKKDKKEHKQKSKDKDSMLPDGRPHAKCYWAIQGRLLGGKYPQQKTIQQYLKAGITFFLDLTEAGEHDLKHYIDAKAKAVKYVRIPIKDHLIPTPADMKLILDTIDNALAQSHVVYIHCHMGVGRTGTVMACYLKRKGMTSEQALSKLAELWKAAEHSKKYKQSPGNPLQIAYVNAYSDDKVINNTMDMSALDPLLKEQEKRIQEKKASKSVGPLSDGRPYPNCYWVIPGVLLAGEYPKEEALKQCLDAGITFFVDLTGKESYIEHYRGQGKTLEHRSIYIKHSHVPSAEDMKKILDTIDNALDNGHKVYVHCAAGKGRTGTVIACYLTRQGLTGEQALERLAELWSTAGQSSKYPVSPEQEEQRQFVKQYQEGTL